MNLEINNIINNITEYMHNQQNYIRRIVADLQDLDKFMSEVLAKLSNFREVDFDRQEGIQRKWKEKSSKAPKTCLVVMLEGNKIHKSKAKDTFIEVIKRIGCQKVVGLIDDKANGNDFIAKQKPNVNAKGYPSYGKTGDFYIIAHYNNKKKKSY